MSNLSLLTRPKCFNDVIGQEMAIQQTINSLSVLLKNQDELIQPIILSGPRGTGKTTTARLIGQYLNCLEDEKNTSIACQCKHCLSIRNDPATAFDYHELDAASQNGVADIEKIIEQSFYAPLGNFKIIVLDEVHMLSRQAFNVLLKQLEEPPKHVLYILATTEEHKILETVRSRCKIRRFNLLADDEIMHHLDGIILNPNLVKNSRGITGEVTDHIVSMAKGSMRDAIKTLDEILDLDDRSLLSVQKSAGSGDIKKLGTLLCYLFDGNLAQVLLELHALEKNGTDPKKLMQQLQLMLTDILNVKAEAAITRLLSPEYYKEKFGISINITQVCDVLGSLIATEGIARNNVTYHVLTYALVECYRKLTDEAVSPIGVTAKEETKTVFPPQITYNPDISDNTANKLSQLLSQKSEKIIKDLSNSLNEKEKEEKEEEEELW